MALITCSICDKENVPDWDGKDHCITCARDIALTTPDTAEAKIRDLLIEIGDYFYWEGTAIDEDKEDFISEYSQKLIGLLVDAQKETIWNIMSPKTEGLFDGGDLFIKRAPIEQAIINMIGYEEYKAMQEAVDALQQTRQEEASE